MEIKKIDEFDVTLLITFHSEGILAHSTLNSVERCKKYAEQFGLRLEYVWVFDSIDDLTRRVVVSHPASKSDLQIVEVNHKDLGASRNSGIAVARGKAIAILDGDDYFSTNWIERAWHYLHEYGSESILHPEFVVNFGAHSAYCWQVDQKGQYYNVDGLLNGNFWTSWTFAFKTVYQNCPYVTTRSSQTGFGYEDWHWNCETIANGYEHRLAWGSIGFYRRKKVSLVATTTAEGAIFPPTKLFSISKF